MKKTVNHQLLTSLLLLFLLLSACVALRSGQLAIDARAAAQNPACDNGARFSSPRRLPSSSDPADIVTGDFNSDGLLDLAVSSPGELLSGGAISIFAGNGRGEFAKVHNIALNNRAYYLARADFNNDGKLDLAAAVTAEGVVVALGRGDWAFTASIAQKAIVRYKTGIAADDFNSDGKADIAFIGDGKLNVMIGDGDGGFAKPVSYSAGATPPGRMSAADFNGDGKLDLIVFGEFFDSKPTLFINDGAGRFTSGATINVTAGGDLRVAVGDLNGDGRPDLAFATLADAPQNRSVAVAFNDGAGNFGSPTLFPDPFDYPSSLAIADFNGDGKSDLVSTNDSSNRVSILLGDGAGMFARRASYNTGSYPIASAVGDFNRDGKLDLATLNSQSNEIAILDGLGDGQFKASRAADFSIYAIKSTALTDVNRDGRLDVVSALAGVQGVMVANGDGAGGFAAPKVYQVGRDNNDIAVADFNKDGWPDIVAAGGAAVFPPYTSSVSLLFGSPAGDFIVSPLNLTAGQTPSTVISADFNKDGNPDLAIGNFISNDVSFLFGNGRGEFAPAVNIPVGKSPVSFAPGDFNNDGNPDLAVANLDAATLSILKGDGRGGFDSASVAVNASPIAIAAADFNNDGQLDLAVGHRNSPTAHNLSVLLGVGDGSFRAPLALATDYSVASVAAGDFTGDGRLDLAVSQWLYGSNYSDRVLIFAGDGAGNFARADEVVIPSAAFLAAGNLNGDGLPDLAVTTRAGVSAALGSCNPPPTNVLTSVSAASYRGVALAPDSIATAFGSLLAATTAAATSLPLPTELAGARVRIKDAAGIERDAPLFFASPAQVNYLVPAGVASGLATVTVAGGDGQTVTGVVLIAPTVPGIFTANADGGGAPAGILLRVKADGTRTIEPIVEFDPAQNRFVPRPIDFFSGSSSTPDQLYLTLFGTGLRNRASATSVTAAVGGIRVDVLYAGAQEDFVGLDQINLQLKQLGGAPKLFDVVVAVDGKASNRVYLKYK